MKTRLMSVMGGMALMVTATLGLILVDAPTEREQAARDLKLIYGIDMPTTPAELDAAYPIVQSRLDALYQDARDATLVASKDTAMQPAATAAGWRHANAWKLALDWKLTADHKNEASWTAAMESALKTHADVMSNLPKRETAGDILKRYGENKKT